MCSWLANRQLTLSLWQLTGQPKPLLGDSRCHQVLVNRVSTLPDGQVSAGPPKPYIVLRNHQLHYSAQAGPGVPGSSPTSSPMQNRILGAMQILRAAQLIGAALGLLKPHLRCFSAFAAKGLRKPPAVWINQVWTQALGRPGVLLPHFAPSVGPLPSFPVPVVCWCLRHQEGAPRRPRCRAAWAVPAAPQARSQPHPGALAGSATMPKFTIEEIRCVGGATLRIGCSGCLAAAPGSDAAAAPAALPLAVP